MHIMQIAKAVGMGKIGPGTVLRHSGRDIKVFACCVPGLFPPHLYKHLLEAQEDEPEPDPEPEQEDDRSPLERLVDAQSNSNSHE
jgi:hypothetical protein